MRTMKTIAVTGGSGKLGRYAVRELLRRQYDVFSLDHRIAPDLPCRQIQTDMQDFGQVAGALQGADAVLHLAAVPAPVGYPHHILFANNVLGSFHVLEAASLLGIRKVVMGSSTSAYGFAWARKPVSPAYFPVDESHPHLAQEGYGLSKTVGELAAGMFHRRSGLGVVNLRFSLIAEPEEYARLREGMSRPASFQKILWSYVDIRDAAEACAEALAADTEGAIALNITGDDTLSDRETVELLREFYPEVTDLRAPLEGRAPLFSNRLARETIGWKPKRGWNDPEP